MRVVNDLIQNISAEKICSGREYRVEFSIIPLCLKIDKQYIFGGVYSYYLKMFEPTENDSFDSWKCDPKAKMSIDACFNEITRFLTNYLVPLFERANSCKTALQEMINLEKLFNDNRKATLKLSGMEDMAGPNAGLNLSDCVKYYMALKNGDYEFALRSIRALEQQNTRNYNSMSEWGYLTKESRMCRENQLEKLRYEIARLEAGDTEYFQRLIEENEAYSRESLKGIF